MREVDRNHTGTWPAKILGLGQKISLACKEARRPGLRDASMVTGAICSMLISSPACAQMSVLTGSASESAVNPQLVRTSVLVRQTPKMDTMPILQAAPGYPERAVYQASPRSAPNGGLHQYGMASHRQTAPSPYRQSYATKSTQAYGSYWHRHPMVRSATIGAGIGAGAGALTGLVSGRGVMHGALVGAGAGAGVGVIRSSQIMRRHPIIKNTATGAVAGLGLGAAAGRGMGWKAAGVGSAIGLGYGLFKSLR
jgi:hypothetical protein